ncbi:MAG TPA: protein kinase [Candidatus Acidoferrales bacterium]|nr:protein kinase [Candidatus Acidoferrales bacterium]
MPIINDDTTVLSSGQRLEDVCANGTGGLRASLDALQARLAIPARYEVIEELGRGGMGIVYKVRDIETCEVIAIKILKPEIAADPAMRESLRKEVCLARRVTHKNVCRIHEFTRSETTACISMEYVSGETLLSKLQRRGALPPIDAVEIAVQICAGLGEAHEQGIVHRDLKPANIVIAHDKTVKIMDFGVARKSHDAANATEDLAGTPAYMSPEQLEMKGVTFQTDIYSLGMILFEMVTGTQAFIGENAVELALLQLRQEPPRPSSIVPAIPARLDTAILRCLEKDPARRFACVGELSAALEKAVAPVTAPARPPMEYKYFQAASVVLQKAFKAAISDSKLLQKELEHGASLLYRPARPKIENCVIALRSFSLKSTSSQRAQAAMFGAAILTTSVLLGFVMRKETHAEQTIPADHVSAKFAMPSPNSSTAALIAPAAPTSPFTAKEFDFDAPPDPSDATIDSADDEPAIPPPTPIVASLKPSHPPHVSSRNLEETRVHSRGLATSGPDQTANLDVNPPPSVPQTVGMLPLENRPGSAKVLALQPVPTLKTPVQPAQDVAPTLNPYLEVGSFNDASWADSAVSHLSQLGFPARAVRKTHLWMQSYRVEVGPFKTLTALETAERTLSDKGFKPHAVK